MEFLILGPLEVSEDGQKLALGGPKQRAVLAHMILQANRVVPADLLIGAMLRREGLATTDRGWCRHGLNCL